MRAPFSAMLPERRGLSIRMRGLASRAASRLITGAADAGWVVAVPAGAGTEPACGVVPGVACGVGFCSSACRWVSARCFSICGTL